MRKFAPTVIFIAVLFIGAGCSNNDSQQAGNRNSAAAAQNSAVRAGQPVFESIPPQAARDLIKARQDLLIIDVRNPQELREGSIEGSHLVPFWNVVRGMVEIPEDRPILLVCAVGGRSYSAGQVLARKGYPEIFNLKGGISAWKRAGLPLKY